VTGAASPSPATGLVVRAARELAHGPLGTLELARRVLGLRGNPPAASRAIFTLLGDDPRFRVDPEGIWTLSSERPAPGPPLTRLSYAVVDVETTGGPWARGHRVTDVAVVPVDGGTVGDGFESLVNPGRPIPPRIQGLTGITDGMVSAAPPFEGIAPRVAAALENRIFVAHNVNFDWGFIRQELVQGLGEAPSPPLLCTLRIGRFLLPRLRGYGLDEVTRHFGIQVHRRHRAYGDALATARLLTHLLLEAESRGLHDLHTLNEALDAPRSRRRRPPLQR
jgi:DNA polymerase III epsilon subunit family exonuclease